MKRHLFEGHITALEELQYWIKEVMELKVLACYLSQQQGVAPLEPEQK